MSFIHLHVHSTHSVRDGLVSIDALVKKAHDLKHPALAITEHGNLNSAFEFYNLCNKFEVKPIIGIEAYLAPKTIKDKEPVGIIKRSIDKAVYNYHLILLAINKIGFENLKILNRIAWLDGFYRKPRIDLPLLKKYNEGLICSTACIGGFPQRMILINRLDLALSAIKKLKKIFGDRLYLEVQNHGMPEQETVMNVTQILSNDSGVKVIATNDIHYLNKIDNQSHKMLMAKQFGKTIIEYEAENTRPGNEYFRTEQEMLNIIQNKEWVNNTMEIAERTTKYNILFESNSRFHFPHFDIKKSNIII